MQEHAPHETRTFHPSTEFGRQVALTGFGRVCPKCWKQWSDKLSFMTDTVVMGICSTTVKVFDEVLKEHQIIALPQRIHRHSCGGEMLIDIENRRGYSSANMSINNG